MSTTITLDLSDSVAEILTTPEGLRRAEALLEAEFASLDLALVDAVREGVEDMRAGRVLPLEDARAASMAAFEERLNAEKAAA